LRALLGVIGAAVLIGIWLVLRRRVHAIEARIWRALRTGFGIVVRCHGSRHDQPGTLYVANHVSWTDIVVLGGLVDTAFVAKDEVARWPVIGMAARRIGCLFVARHQRGQAGGQVRELHERLSGHGHLVLFAEGTTGPGNGVLPFRSSLFAAADNRTVQPVTLCWRRRDGAPFAPAERGQFAWLDDDALLSHAVRLAWTDGASVDVHYETPVQAPDRKSAARACEAAIAARLAADTQAATLRRRC